MLWLRKFFGRFCFVTKGSVLRKLEKLAFEGGFCFLNRKEHAVLDKLIILKYIDRIHLHISQKAGVAKEERSLSVSDKHHLFTDKALLYLEKNGYQRCKETVLGMALFDLLASIGGVAGIIAFCKWCSS